MWKRATVGLVPFHFSALPACGDYLRIGNRMFRAPSCGTCPSQLAFAFLIAHFAHLAVVLPAIFAQAASEPALFEFRLHVDSSSSG
jgi:hypothetical protein